MTIVTVRAARWRATLAVMHGHDHHGMTRAEASHAFVEHARSYVMVNALLVVIWLVTSPGGYFWPIWPILGWGLGLVFHAIGTFGSSTRYADDDL